MAAILSAVNGVLWGYVLIYALIAVGVYFTFRLRFLQLRHFSELVRASIAAPAAGDESGISSFQALCTSLASRVGTGNIAGVAVALVMGGPGAIFWMWVVAFLGMATSYAESTLAQLYKVKDRSVTANAPYRGGPAYYMARGLGLPWLGAIFSIGLIFAVGLVVNALQANSIADAMDGAFGVSKIGTGIMLALLTALVIFGGIRKIAKVAEWVVPFMAGVYLVVTLAIVALNITEVPAVLWSIIENAFGMDEAIGGLTGGMMAAILNGVKRGLLSNEAGMGSAPNIAAAATPTPHHPSAQGFVQAFGVFIDTIVVCTCTALIILLGDAYVPAGELTGTYLTQVAMEGHIGSFGPTFIAIAIFFFAFTTIIGSYAYAEMAMAYLKFDGRIGLTVLRFAVLGMVVWGSLQSVSLVFAMADAFLGVIAAINLVVLILLSKKVFALTNHYFAERKAGREPRFVADEHPDISSGVDHEIWR